MDWGGNAPSFVKFLNYALTVCFAAIYNIVIGIEVASFIITFYEVSGTDEEKGKEKTPKAEVSLRAFAWAYG